MKKIRIYMMCLVSCAVALFFAACGSSSSDDDGGGGGSGAVGSWKCTSFEGNPNSGFYWHFMEDGTLYLNESSSPGGARTGTYSVSGNRITGSGVNPGSGTFDIDFKMDGDAFAGDFFEHWGGGKHVPIVAEKVGGSSGNSSSGGSSGSDEVAFSALNWTYGGVNAASASPQGVQIANLKASGMTMSFKYVTDLSAWGMSHADASALACYFVKNSAGQWVGGKIDWISSSRTTRDLSHCKNYNGWTLTGIPNPTEAAFVIVTGNGSKRSNVIKTTWQR